MSLSALPEQACEAVDLGEDPKRFDFAFAFDNADFAGSSKPLFHDGASSLLSNMLSHHRNRSERHEVV